MVDKRETIKQEDINRTNPRAQFLGSMEGTSIPNLGTLRGDRFLYPIDKRRTRDNVEAMRAAERHLTCSGKRHQHIAYNKAPKIRATAIWNRLLAQPWMLQRTPEWVDSSKALRSSEEKEVEALCKPLSGILFNLERRTESTVHHDQRPSQKTKEKSRGVTRPVEEPALNEVLDRHLQDVQPLFTVDKRAYKVFTILLYTPSTSSQPGEVPWLDFCHAMLSTGFVVEKLYGSVWQFTPTRLDVERSINFHEPHPSGKLPFRTARRYGRRLNRLCGWYGGMFVQS